MPFPTLDHAIRRVAEITANLEYVNECLENLIVGAEILEQNTALAAGRLDNASSLQSALDCLRDLRLSLSSGTSAWKHNYRRTLKSLKNYNDALNERLTGINGTAQGGSGG